MARKLQLDIDKLLKDVQASLDRYDEKFDEYCAFLEAFHHELDSGGGAVEDASLLRGRKHSALRSAGALDRVDVQHAIDQKKKLECELETCLKKVKSYNTAVEQYCKTNEAAQKDELRRVYHAIEIRYKRGREFYREGLGSEAVLHKLRDRQEGLTESERRLQTMIETLTQQQEAIETEILQLQKNLKERTSRAEPDTSKRKTAKTKRQAKSPPPPLDEAEVDRINDRISQIQAVKSNHGDHIRHLETIKRRLANQDQDITESLLDDLHAQLEPYVDQSDDYAYLVYTEIYEPFGTIVPDQTTTADAHATNEAVVAAAAAASPSPMAVDESPVADGVEGIEAPGPPDAAKKDLRGRKESIVHRGISSHTEARRRTSGTPSNLSRQASVTPTRSNATIDTALAKAAPAHTPHTRPISRPSNDHLDAQLSAQKRRKKAGEGDRAEDGSGSVAASSSAGMRKGRVSGTQTPPNATSVWKQKAIKVEVAPSQPVIKDDGEGRSASPTPASASPVARGMWAYGPPVASSSPGHSPSPPSVAPSSQPQHSEDQHMGGLRRESLHTQSSSSGGSAHGGRPRPSIDASSPSASDGERATDSGSSPGPSPAVPSVVVKASGRGTVPYTGHSGIVRVSPCNPITPTGVGMQYAAKARTTGGKGKKADRPLLDDTGSFPALTRGDGDASPSVSLMDERASGWAAPSSPSIPETGTESPPAEPDKESGSTGQAKALPMVDGTSPSLPSAKTGGTMAEGSPSQATCTTMATDKQRSEGGENEVGEKLVVPTGRVRREGHVRRRIEEKSVWGTSLRSTDTTLPSTDESQLDPLPYMRLPTQAAFPSLASSARAMEAKKDWRGWGDDKATASDQEGAPSTPSEGRSPITIRAISNTIEGYDPQEGYHFPPLGLISPRSPQTPSAPAHRKRSRDEGQEKADEEDGKGDQEDEKWSFRWLRGPTPPRPPSTAQYFVSESSESDPSAHTTPQPPMSLPSPPGPPPPPSPMMYHDEWSSAFPLPVGLYGSDTMLPTFLARHPSPPRRFPPRRPCFPCAVGGDRGCVDSAERDGEKWPKEVLVRRVEVHEVLLEWRGDETLRGGGILGDDERPSLLEPEKGRMVEVLYWDPSGWTYGRLQDQPERVGWFPYWTIYPLSRTEVGILLPQGLHAQRTHAAMLHRTTLTADHLFSPSPPPGRSQSLSPRRREALDASLRSSSEAPRGDSIPADELPSAEELLCKCGWLFASPYVDSGLPQTAASDSGGNVRDGQGSAGGDDSDTEDRWSSLESPCPPQKQPQPPGPRHHHDAKMRASREHHVNVAYQSSPFPPHIPLPLTRKMTDTDAKVAEPWLRRIWDTDTADTAGHFRDRCTFAKDAAPYGKAPPSGVEEPDPYDDMAAGSTPSNAPHHTADATRASRSQRVSVLQRQVPGNAPPRRVQFSSCDGSPVPPTPHPVLLETDDHIWFPEAAQRDSSPPPATVTSDDTSPQSSSRAVGRAVFDDPSPSHASQASSPSYPHPPTSWGMLPSQASFDSSGSLSLSSGAASHLPLPPPVPPPTGTPPATEHKKGPSLTYGTIKILQSSHAHHAQPPTPPAPPPEELRKQPPAAAGAGDKTAKKGQWQYPPCPPPLPPSQQRDGKMAAAGGGARAEALLGSGPQQHQHHHQHHQQQGRGYGKVWASVLRDAANADFSPPHRGHPALPAPPPKILQLQPRPPPPPTPSSTLTAITTVNESLKTAYRPDKASASATANTNTNTNNGGREGGGLLRTPDFPSRTEVRSQAQRATDPPLPPRMDLGMQAPVADEMERREAARTIVQTVTTRAQGSIATGRFKIQNRPANPPPRRPPFNPPAPMDDAGGGDDQASDGLPAVPFWFEGQFHPAPPSDGGRDEEVRGREDSPSTAEFPPLSSGWHDRRRDGRQGQERDPSLLVRAMTDFSTDHPPPAPAPPPYDSRPPPPRPLLPHQPPYYGAFNHPAALKPTDPATPHGKVSFYGGPPQVPYYGLPGHPHHPGHARVGIQPSVEGFRLPGSAGGGGKKNARGRKDQGHSQGDDGKGAGGDKAVRPGLLKTPDISPGTVPLMGPPREAHRPPMRPSQPPPPHFGQSAVHYRKTNHPQHQHPHHQQQRGGGKPAAAPPPPPPPVNTNTSSSGSSSVNTEVQLTPTDTNNHNSSSKEDNGEGQAQQGQGGVAQPAQPTLARQVMRWTKVPPEAAATGNSSRRKQHKGERGKANSAADHKNGTVAPPVFTSLREDFRAKQPQPQHQQQQPQPQPPADSQTPEPAIPPAAPPAAAARTEAQTQAHPQPSPAASSSASQGSGWGLQQLLKLGQGMFSAPRRPHAATTTTARQQDDAQAQSQAGRATSGGGAGDSGEGERAKGEGQGKKQVNGKEAN